MSLVGRIKLRSALEWRSHFGLITRSRKFGSWIFHDCRGSEGSIRAAFTPSPLSSVAPLLSPTVRPSDRGSAAPSFRLTGPVVCGLLTNWQSRLRFEFRVFENLNLFRISDLGSRCSVLQLLSPTVRLSNRGSVAPSFRLTSPRGPWLFFAIYHA